MARVTSWTAKKVQVKYNAGGGSQILKSSGPMALLSAQANKCAANCNALGASQSRGSNERPRFVAEPVSLNWTGGYRVRCDNFAAWLADRNHNTLMKGCS